jgi:uncharacterized protein YdhG (YjbR/CyaY superfamily)
MNRDEAVDRYLANLPRNRRETLAEIRKLIRETVPETIESMRYRMPTYEYGGNPLCAFASRKAYMSLYIHTRLFEKYKAELCELNMGKECIRFTQLNELPFDTIRLILREAIDVERA